jgi:hypothetical protein
MGLRDTWYNGENDIDTWYNGENGLLLIFIDHHLTNGKHPSLSTFSLATKQYSNVTNLKEDPCQPAIHT